MTATPIEIDEEDAPSFSDVPLPSGGYVKQDGPSARMAAYGAVLGASSIAMILWQRDPHSFHVEINPSGAARYTVIFSKDGDSISWNVTPTVSGPWKVERA